MAVNGIIARASVWLVCLSPACKSSPERAGARAESASSASAHPATLASAAAPTAPAPSASAAASSAAPHLPPLESASALVPLLVPTHEDAVVFVPRGARDRRPVVIALHGNYDRPEWQCDVFRKVTDAFPFILCPRGAPRLDVPKTEDRWTYASVDKTFAEVSAAREALVARFGAHVSDAKPVLVAFSLGAIYAARYLPDHPESFPRAALIEGGYEGWTAPRVRRFAEGGGKRVLIACAQTACRNAARAAAPIFEKYGVGYRWTYAPGAGHTYDGEVAQRVAGEWEWLTH